MGNQQNTTGGNDCPKFLALAILLLEISFGQPLEEIRQPDDLGSKTAPDDETNFQTANRWYKAESRRLSPGFSQAILTCLQQYLNPEASLEDDDYCDVIKEKVLQPLEDEMQYMVFGPRR